MMVARWQIEARFGHKDQALASMKKWIKQIGSKAGMTPDRVRILTGSIGALESTIETEFYIENLDELDQYWTKLAKLKTHKKWGLEFEKHTVSGTARWQIFRVVE